MTKPGHERPLLDNSNELNLFAGPITGQPAGESVPIETPQPADSASETEIKPVAEIMSEHEQRAAERAARWQELTDSNWPPGRVEETLRIEFPDLKTPDKIEQDDKRQDAAVNRHARALHGDKPSRPNRPYRARYKDTTDRVTRQLRDI